MTVINIPRRVFLDTNVINFIMDYSDSIFENAEIQAGLPLRDIADIEALRLIFETGARAHWELAVSNVTYVEITNTVDKSRRKALQGWFSETWSYWRDCFDEDGGLSDDHANKLAVEMECSGALAMFPDPCDRTLIAHAIAYNCDAFCTRDSRTILKKVSPNIGVGIEFLSPQSWGARVKCVAALF